MSVIRLIVGGQPRELAVHFVGDLLPGLTLPPDGRGIAIAINDAVVPKSRWLEHELRDGDRVEIVKAVPGG